ncbi:MAG: ACT domain-containing protein, partial [Chloroflexi bacterium]|nr:ACT domain-containing protein [Chloroflexota bacterium]
ELQITGARPENLWGTVVHEIPHIVRIGPYHVDIASTNGYLLFSYHQDQPGMIGREGTILGAHDINISFMQVGREAPRGAALTVLGLDEQPSPEVLAELRAIPGLNTATLVKL